MALDAFARHDGIVGSRALAWKAEGRRRRSRFDV
jgi:hypothetical protein